MKLYPFLALLLLPVSGFSQPEYARADAWADSIDQNVTDIAELTQRLIRPFTTEKDKARVIYTWIARHIRFDCQKLKHPEPFRSTGKVLSDTLLEKQRLDNEQARQVLRRKKGVSADYSRLFKALCEAAALEAVMIDGWGRSFYEPFGKLPKKPNHTWNAVKIDGRWQLVDVTWAAGYLDESSSKFTMDFQSGYFLTPSERFVQDHLPLEEKWQLTPCLVSRQAFPKQAYVNSAQLSYPVEDYWPKSGELIANDRQIELCVRFVQAPPALVVASRSSVALDYKQSLEDGFLVLRFKAPPRGEVGIYGGEKKGKKIWLLRYTY